jgi:DinB superfamily
MTKRSWLQEIDIITEKYKISFQDLTTEEFNYKPKQEVWSIAQNIAHVILLNSSYFKSFTEIQNGDHKILLNENLENLAQSSLDSLQPYASSERIKRENTWDIWQPLSSNMNKDILRDFEKHQLDFKHHIEGFKDFSIQTTFIKYPGHANLIFKLDDCLNMLIDHENRHWNQANEIVKLL